MAKTTKKPETEQKRKSQPALTMEAREDQMISLAMNCVEQRLRDGTASSQEVTHFLKLGSTKNRLEKEKLRRENDLLAAKKENLEQAARTEEMFAKALEAIRSYRGISEEYEEDI